MAFLFLSQRLDAGRNQFSQFGIAWYG